MAGTTFGRFMWRVSLFILTGGLACSLASPSTGFAANAAPFGTVDEGSARVQAESSQEPGNPGGSCGAKEDKKSDAAKDKKKKSKKARKETKDETKKEEKKPS